jgi:hypothetical protein
MSKIVRKIYHIRKYDNIDHESNRRVSTMSPGVGPTDGFEGDTERNQNEIDLVNSG